MVDDYRSQRSPSPEGSGHAKEAWEEFHLVRARDLTEEAGAKPWSGGPAGLPEDDRDDLVAAVIEESELLGFWLRGGAPAGSRVSKAQGGTGPRSSGSYAASAAPSAPTPTTTSRTGSNSTYPKCGPWRSAGA